MEFSKIGKHDVTFIREIRVLNLSPIYRTNKTERKERNEIGQAKLKRLCRIFYNFNFLESLRNRRSATVQGKI